MQSENVHSNPRPKSAAATSSLQKSTPLRFPKEAQAQSTPTPASRPKTASCVKRLPFTPTTPSACAGGSNAALLSPTSSVGGQSTCSASKEAVRLSKEAHIHNTARKVAELKERWAKEKERKLALHKQQKEQEMKKLTAAQMQSAEARKRELAAKHSFEAAAKAQEQEQLAASLADRNHSIQERERMEKERRRRSVLLNDGILKMAREREARLAAQKKEEEAELLSGRRIDYLQLREAKREEERCRRESLVQRGRSLQQQKQTEEELRKAREEEDKKILESRYEGWQNASHASRERAKRDRESLAGRLDSWREGVQVEKELEEQAAEQHHQDLEDRRMDWLQLQQYKKEVAQRDRESIAGRLQEWRDQRMAMSAKQEQEEREAREFEETLRVASDRALKAAQEREKQNRRQSLAYRLEKAREEKNLEESQRMVRAAIEEEERRIALLDAQDVSDYKHKLQLARRQSLEFRNQTASQQRMQDSSVQEIARAEAEAERELRDAEWKDVLAYQAKERERERQSLAGRLAAAKAEQEFELTEHRKKLDAMHEDLSLKRLAWLDTRSVAAEEEEKSRRSIACRLDSWRQQKLAEEMMAADKELMRQEEARLREMDREALAQAKAQEREREMTRNYTPSFTF